MRCLRMAALYWLLVVSFLVVPVCSAPAVYAESAILLDGDTGRVLYEKNPDQRSLVASTTKIMTALLIVEGCCLQQPVCVPEEAVGIEGSSIYLKAGERVTVEMLLYGLLLQSGNDAAAALAIFHSGSLDAFADNMNRKALEIGLTQTQFKNPHGLDQCGHYSTARDLALLASVAMKNSTFRQIVSTRSIVFEDRVFSNHNKLLWRYAGADGIKTGYTKRAGRILVGSAFRDDRRLIVVTINDSNDWNDHAALLDYGFSSYHKKMLIKQGEIFGSVSVISGAEKTVQACTREPFLYTVASHETITLCPELPEFVYAPILAGQQAGRVLIYVDGLQAAELPLFWRYSVLEEP